MTREWLFGDIYAHDVDEGCGVLGVGCGLLVKVAVLKKFSAVRPPTFHIPTPKLSQGLSSFCAHEQLPNVVHTRG